jgi:hypothetical protein
MVLARWTAHPAKRRPRDLFLVLAVVLLTAGAVLASLESLLLTVLSAVFLVIAVAPFLFPTHYTLTDLGVSERRLWRHKVRQWADLRRLQVGAGAALVSPFAQPHWLDRYRGLILMLDGADRDQVIEILRERMARGPGQVTP